MKYIVHDLVQITVDDDLARLLGDSLEFQIGYFKVPADHAGSDTLATITVQPFERFKQQLADFGNVSEFHLAKGVEGLCSFSEIKHLAVVRTDTGFAIYADGPNFLINLYIQLALFEQGYTMVHAAAYSDDDGITLLAGPGGVGKTALLGYMVSKYQRQILGDDIIIIRRDGHSYSFPRAFVLKEYHREVYPELFRELNIKRWSTYPIKRFIIDNMPFTGLIKNGLRRIGKYYAVAVGLGMDPYLATVPVEKIFGAGVVLGQGKVKRIIFVERYDGDTVTCEPMAAASMVQRLFAIIHHEWKEVLDELFIMGSLELVDLADYFKTVESTIVDFVDGKELKMIRVPNGTPPDALVAEFEKFGLT